jgi:hypothetical protein
VLLQCPDTGEASTCSPDAHDRSGVLGDPVGPRVPVGASCHAVAAFWVVHVEHHGPNQRRGVGVDVGTFEGLLAWVVLMPAASSRVQASHFGRLDQTGKWAGRVVTCGTFLTGDAIAPDACQRCGFFWPLPT